MSRLRTLIVVVLVMLAASPLTAPFATFDLFDLLGDDTAATSGAMKPPKAPDSPTPAITASLTDCRALPRSFEPGLGATVIDQLNHISLPLRL